LMFSVGYIGKGSSTALFIGYLVACGADDFCCGDRSNDMDWSGSGRDSSLEQIDSNVV